MRPKPPTNYLTGYPPSLVEHVYQLIAQDRLGEVLLKKYPQPHAIRTDKALYDYVQALKNAYLRNVGPLDKVAFDSTMKAVQQVLGTNTRVSRVQGARLKSKHEIRVATVFREAPPEFLRLIVVHELAHLKEREHNKAFYQLCQHMEPAYHPLEFDLRTYLHFMDTTGVVLWKAHE